MKLLLVIFFCLPLIALSQITKNALFIGNSYTAYNNLPQMVGQCATSTGDQLIFNSNTPGGATFQGHTTNATTLEKIQLGDWDFVVLQEQSQRPAFPDAQVAQDVFPFAAQLDALIKTHNPCAETIFYMTWGRKNGDSQNCPVWPPICTYEGMDSLLHLRYMQMAEQNQAMVSPVGAIWRFLRENHAAIELYNPDESHPSYAGSYAAACSFYTVIFRKDPTLITWNGSLSAQDASTIRNAAKTIVFDSLSNWYVGTRDPIAAFEYNNVNTVTVDFVNQSENFESSSWSINGQEVSTETNFQHTFPVTGLYQVSLTVSRCDYSSTITQDVVVGGLSINAHENKKIKFYPNPVSDFLHIENPPLGKVVVLDALGRVVLEENVDFTSNYQIDLSKLNSGLYYLIIDENSFLIQKQ
jgi:hypothetical protein